MSFLLDFIGGAAGTGASILQKEREEEAALERQTKLMELQELMAEKRMQTAEKLKEEREATKAKRVSKETEEARAGGEAMRKESNVTGLLGLAGKQGASFTNDKTGEVFESAPSVSKDEMEQALEKNKKVYEDAGYIPKVRESGLIGDAIKVANNKGYTDAAKGLKEEQKYYQGREDAADKDQREERKIAATETKNEQTAKYQADTIAQRDRATAAREANRDRKDDSDKETYRALELHRKKYQGLVNGAERRLREEEEALKALNELEVINGATEETKKSRIAVQTRVKKAEDAYIDFQNKLIDGPDGPETKSTDKQKDSKPTKPPSIASITGAPAGSSVGGFVDGKGWEIRNAAGKVIGHAKE